MWTALALLGAAGAVVAGGQGLWWLAVGPVLEEWVFRAGLHEALLRLAARPGGLTLQPGQGRRRHGRRLLSGAAINLWVALAFAGTHLLAHSPAWAWATALPALAVGALYQRRRQWGACALVHGLFNLVWLAAVAPLLPQLATLWEPFA